MDGFLVYREYRSRFIIAKNKAGTKQIVIYIGDPNTESDLLLFAVKNPSSVEFIDLSNNRDIAFDINSGFPVPMIMGSTKSLVDKIKNMNFKNYKDQRVALTVEDIKEDYSMQCQMGSTESDCRGMVVYKNIADIIAENNHEEGFGYIIAHRPKSKCIPIIAYTHDIDPTDDQLFIPAQEYKGLYVPGEKPNRCDMCIVYTLDHFVDSKDSSSANNHMMNIPFDIGTTKYVNRFMLGTHDVNENLWATAGNDPIEEEQKNNENGDSVDIIDTTSTVHASSSFLGSFLSWFKN